MPIERIHSWSFLNDHSDDRFGASKNPLDVSEMISIPKQPSAGHRFDWEFPLSAFRFPLLPPGTLSALVRFWALLPPAP
jgi:hypothetical protein